MNSNGNSPKPRLVVIQDLFGTLYELQKKGNLSRLQLQYKIYSNYFNNIRLLTFEGKKIKSLPRTIEHVPFMPFLSIENKSFRQILYFFFGGVSGYCSTDYVEVIGTTAIGSALIYKLNGSRIFLYHPWSLSEYLKIHRNPFLAITARFIEIFAFKISDVVAVSAIRLGEDAAKYTNKDKIHYLPNWVDTDQFYPLNIKKIENLIVTVGRLHPAKNLYMLFDCMKDLHQYKLWVIGDGPLREELNCYLKVNKIYNIELLGAIANEELPNYLNKAEVFIMVSHGEGNPVALIEALSCGLPCIGTNVKGINDIIIDSKNGILCDKSIEGIKNSISTLFSDKDLMEKLSKNGRQFVLKNYSKNKILKRRTELILGSYDSSHISQ